MRNKRIVFIVLLLFLGFILTACGGPDSTYKNAQELLAQGKYAKAAEKFESLGSYEDAVNLTIYCKACALCESGDYETGIAALEKMGDYKDCTMRIAYFTARSWDDASKDNADYEMMAKARALYNENLLYLDSMDRIASLDKRMEKVDEEKYNAAVALMNAGKYSDAYDAFVALNGYKDSTEKANSLFSQVFVEKSKSVKVGDYLIFGTYEQDGNSSNGTEPIEWLVLAKENKRLLVISRYALDAKPYEERATSATWETCSLRKWLNNDFINAAFSSAEQTIIPAVTVSADKNTLYYKYKSGKESTDPGKSTNDKIFLLSAPEIEKYLASKDARKCNVTTYSKQLGAAQNSATSSAKWWMRSPGKSQESAGYIMGGSNANYCYGINRVCGVRPALWIDLDP
ncbi:MAG: hypothetical protein E7324_03660 [Clostridiales bacterium]|nr:hypothetical protein [Clostridiales bacterium]